ncbi:hypothetical protein FOZ63_033697 [Perkinsus olseni]|nr:hypothetical protein FOZ63_033697 [Perkinsus olseni]
MRPSPTLLRQVVAGRQTLLSDVNSMKVRELTRAVSAAVGGSGVAPLDRRSRHLLPPADMCHRLACCIRDRLKEGEFNGKENLLILCLASFAKSSYRHTAIFREITEVLLNTGLLVSPNIPTSQSIAIVLHVTTISSSDAGALVKQVLTSILANPLPLTGPELASIFTIVFKAGLSEKDVPLGHLEALAERSIRNGCLLGIEPASLTSLALSHAKVRGGNATPSAVPAAIATETSRRAVDLSASQVAACALAVRESGEGDTFRACLETLGRELEYKLAEMDFDAWCQILQAFAPGPAAPTNYAQVANLACIHLRRAYEGDEGGGVSFKQAVGACYSLAKHWDFPRDQAMELMEKLSKSIRQFPVTSLGDAGSVAHLWSVMKVSDIPLFHHLLSCISSTRNSDILPVQLRKLVLAIRLQPGLDDDIVGRFVIWCTDQLARQLPMRSVPDTANMLTTASRLAAISRTKESCAALKSLYLRTMEASIPGRVYTTHTASAKLLNAVTLLGDADVLADLLARLDVPRSQSHRAFGNRSVLLAFVRSCSHLTRHMRLPQETAVHLESLRKDTMMLMTEKERAKDPSCKCVSCRAKLEAAGGVE